jgi:hypothetical protein
LNSPVNLRLPETAHAAQRRHDARLFEMDKKRERDGVDLRATTTAASRGQRGAHSGQQHPNRQTGFGFSVFD